MATLELPRLDRMEVLAQELLLSGQPQQQTDDLREKIQATKQLLRTISSRWNEIRSEMQEIRRKNQEILALLENYQQNNG